MSNGYKQFFKTAQNVKRGDVPPPPAGGSVKKHFKVKTPPRSTDVEETLRQALNKRPARRRSPFPWRALAGLSVTLAGLGFYLSAPDYVENILSKVEVTVFGKAQAKDVKPAEKSKSAPSQAEKPAAQANPDGKIKTADENKTITEELSHFQKLKQRKDELDLREKELAQLEEELQRQKVELDKRITQLEEMRGQIAQILKERVELDQEKVNKLVDLYSNMKPKQAADIIGSINEDLAVEILAKMKKKSAAEIMNLLPPEKAKVLSEKYTGYRRALASDPKG